MFFIRTSILPWWIIIRLLFLHSRIVVNENECAVVGGIRIALRTLVARAEVALLSCSADSPLDVPLDWNIHRHHMQVTPSQRSSLAGLATVVSSDAARPAPTSLLMGCTFDVKCHRGQRRAWLVWRRWKRGLEDGQDCGRRSRPSAAGASCCSSRTESERMTLLQTNT